MTPCQTVVGIYAAFQRGDILFSLNQLAPDVLWREPGSVSWGGDYHGPAETGAFFAKLNGALKTTRNRATNKTSRERFAFRWHFRGGKVTSFDAAPDTTPIMAAAVAV